MLNLDRREGRRGEKCAGEFRPGENVNSFGLFVLLLVPFHPNVGEGVILSLRGIAGGGSDGGMLGGSRDAHSRWKWPRGLVFLMGIAMCSSSESSSESEHGEKTLCSAEKSDTPVYGVCAGEARKAVLEAIVAVGLSVSTGLTLPVNGELHRKESAGDIGAVILVEGS